MNIAIIPVRGNDTLYKQEIEGKSLLQRAIEAADVDSVYISTDSEEVAAYARKLGAEVPFLRDEELSAKGVKLEQVFQDFLEKLEQDVDIVVTMEITHPFRPKGLVGQMVKLLQDHDFDTVFTGIKEKDSFWKEEDGALRRIDEESLRKERAPMYRELLGVGCATKAALIKEGIRVGRNVGIVPVSGPAAIEVKSEKDLKLAAYMKEHATHL